MRGRNLVAAALLAAGVVAMANRPAHATLISGPTPTGTGAWGYCNVNIGPDYQSTQARCTYGLPAAGATPTLQLYYDGHGWQDVTLEVLYGDAEFYARWNTPVAWPLPAGARFRYSTAQVLPVSVLSQRVTQTGDYSPPDWPQWGFGSAITNTPVAPVSLPDHVATGLDTARSQLPSWTAEGVAVVVAVAIAGCAAFLVVRLLHRAAAGAGLTEVGEGELEETERIDALAYQEHDGNDDAEGDDQVDEDDAYDLTGDEGADDDAGVTTGVGLGDVLDCVDCGAELEYGWDFDVCPECSGV